MKLSLLVMALALASACDDASDTDYTVPSPVIEGRWSLTLTPARAADDCIARGALPDMPLPASFTVRMTAAGPLVNEGQTEPGLVEVYRFDGATVTVDSYYDTGMTGHASMRATRRAVTGVGVFSVESPTCSQEYSISGVIQ